MRYRTDFIVEGSGQFPFDMLRYDSCFPARGEDSSLLEEQHREKRQVRLSKYHGDRSPRITPNRWKSFTWRFVEIIETVKL